MPTIPSFFAPALNPPGEGDGWRIAPEVTGGSIQERQDLANQRFFSSWLKLQREEVQLFRDLLEASSGGTGLVIRLDGLEPNLEEIFTLLRCAYQFQVAVTFVPNP